MLVMSSGVMILNAIADDLTNSHNCGQEAFNTFIDINFSGALPSDKFHNRMTKQHLQTCSDIVKKCKVTFAGREMILKADRTSLQKC